MSSGSSDGGGSSLETNNSSLDATEKDNAPSTIGDRIQITEESANQMPTDKSKSEGEDYVSGVLYDILQKEVITLRKACHEKNQSLKDKDDAIEV